MQIVPKNCAKRRFLGYPVLEQFENANCRSDAAVLLRLLDRRR